MAMLRARPGVSCFGRAGPSARTAEAPQANGAVQASTPSWVISLTATGSTLAGSPAPKRASASISGSPWPWSWKSTTGSRRRRRR